MQQWIDLSTKVTNDSLAAFKQAGELNTKATESFFGQQKEMFDSQEAAAKSNMEKLVAVKDSQGFLDMQNEVFQSTVTSVFSNWKKMMELSSTNYEAYRDLAEETAQTTKNNAEEAMAFVKPVAKEAN